MKRRQCIMVRPLWAGFNRLMPRRAVIEAGGIRYTSTNWLAWMFVKVERMDDVR